MKLKTFTTVVLPVLCCCKNLALHIQGKASVKAKDPVKENKEFASFASFIKSELEEKEYSVGVVEEKKSLNISEVISRDLIEAANKAKTEDEKHHYFPNKLLLSYDCHGNPGYQCGYNTDQWIDILYKAKYEWYHADAIAIVANGCHSKDFWNKIMQTLESRHKLSDLKISWVVTSSCEEKYTLFRKDYKGTPWHQFFSGKYTDLEHNKLSKRQPFFDWMSSPDFMTYQWEVQELAELAGGECRTDSCHKVHFLQSTKNPTESYLKASDWNLQPKFMSSKYTSNFQHIDRKLDCWKPAESKIHRALTFDLTARKNAQGDIPTQQLIRKFQN